ncbi:chromatin structure-remodeling complex subunit RSC3/30 [Microdochium nivale]|nr:chromatin structure-remodeling complex subunit RSC3/30 [Microdochium nivale]
MDLQGSPRELRPQPSSSARAGVGRRRNGKLQSCEPCRKSKLRCDHSVPCSRCLRRRLADQCVFHPHPLTKNKAASEEILLATPASSSTATPATRTSSLTASSRAVPRSTSLRSRVEPRPESVNQRRQQSSGSVSSPSCSRSNPAEVISPAATAATDERSLHNEHNPGYVGVTSYSTILSEGFADLATAVADQDQDQDPADEHRCKQQQAVAEANMDRSCEVLAFLQNRALIDDFADHFHQLEEDGGLLGQPILDTWRAGLWAAHGEVLQKQDADEIRGLAELLWDNSHRPAVLSRDMSTRQWAEADTGPGIRWVTVGLVVAMVGICAQQILETHVLFRRHAIERRRLLAEAAAVMQACLSFYRQCNIVDLRLAWLVLAVSIMPEPAKSDFSYASYRESGELNDIVITMGLHQPPRADMPLFHAELCKRTFLCAYAREIATATFLGRPPRLSHRYCSVDPPLDLSDQELFLDPPELAAAVARLDSRGFNPDLKFRRSSYMRAWISMSIAREDLLDLALGKHTLDETVAAAARISRSIEDKWASYPDFISRIRTEKVSTLFASDVKNALTPLQSLLQYSIRHGTKSTELLLQLVVIRKANSVQPQGGAGAGQHKIKPDTMIRIASEFLTGCLELSQNKTLVYNFPQDVSAFIGNQGMRAAAIIGVELLKQEQRQRQYQHGGGVGVAWRADDAEDQAPPPLLPRSQTIQNLAVFASVLASTDPSDGMAAICAQGRKVIGRILDKLLTPEFNIGPQMAVSKGVVDSTASSSLGNDSRLARDDTNSSLDAQQQTQTLPGGRGGATRQAAIPAPPIPGPTTTTTATTTHVHPAVLTASSTGGSSSGSTGVDATTSQPSLPSSALPAGNGPPQDVDLWNLVYGSADEGAPFLGYDHDFMAWLENMDFDGRI